MPPKVSEEHRAERRAQLLQSALKCFSEQGYEATTVDDIVKSAGVSKGMAYTYFTSKEEIFLELVGDRTNQFFNQLILTFEKLPGAWEKLRYLLETRRMTPLTAEARKWVAVYLEFFLSASRDESRQDFMQQRYARFVQMMKEVIHEGMKNGEFRQDIDANAIASLYWAICDGIDLHYSQLADVMDADAVYLNAIEMVRRAVVKDAGSQNFLGI